MFARMNIARIRKLRGLTQVDLAEMAGVTQSTISRAEAGDGGVTLGTFRQIAEALHAPLHDLFKEDTTWAETILLDLFRHLPSERQKGWIEMARQAVAETQPEDR